MITMNQPFKRNTLAAAILMAVCLPTAQALEISAELSGSTNGTPFTPITDTTTSGSVYVNGFFGNASGWVVGDDTGDFASRVRGNGEYDITGVFSYSDTITNTSGTAQLYDFTFDIIPGGISLSGDPSASGSSGFLLAEYSIDILVNGASVWDSSAKVEKDDTSAGSATFTYSGTSLGGTETDSSAFSAYNWGSFFDSIALGTLDDGESLDFEYILTTRAAGNADNCFAGFDGGEGFNGIDFDGGEGGGRCGSLVGNGDPFDFSANTSNINVTPVITQVPEPGSLALLGLGLAGVIATRRRKKNNTK